MFTKAIERLHEIEADAVVVRIIGDEHAVVYDRHPEAKGKEKKKDQNQHERSPYPTYTVFRIKDSYYAVDENLPLGNGAFGIVYNVFQIDPLTGEKDESAPPFVAKIPTEEVIDKFEIAVITEKFKLEAKFNSRFYRTKFVTNPDGLPMIVMEYVNGKPIFDKKGEPHSLLAQLFQSDGESHPLLAKFSLFELLNHIISQYYIWANIIHHESPKRGKAFVHRDLNETNVQLFYNEETQQLEVYFLDFGTALELENENEMHQAGIEGMSHLFPPEMTSILDESNLHDNTGIVGTVSDIFQLALLSLRTLKGRDRFYDERIKEVDFNNQNEKEAIEDTLHNAKVPCDTTGLLEGVKVPEVTFANEHVDLGELMHNFTSYALNLDYQSRAITEEGLNFHLTVGNLCQLLKKNPTNKEERVALAKEKLVYIAKLCIISQGLWRTKIGEKLVDQHIYDDENVHVQSGAHIVDKTFADFEFQFEPEQCINILKAYQTKTLSEDSEVIQSIKAKEKEKLESALGESIVREKLDEIFKLPREEVETHLVDDHLEMILDIALAGIHDYQNRNSSHLSFWKNMMDGGTGKVRAENYKKLFENENYSLFTRMMVLYALLVSHDGKTLQNDVTKSFQLLFKRDFKIEALKPIILNIIRINKNENVTMAAIDCNIGQIVNKLNRQSIPSHDVLNEIENLGKAVPQSLHNRSKTL